MRWTWVCAYFVHTNLAAAFVHAGKMDEAKAELAEARRLNPAITIKSTRPIFRRCSTASTRQGCRRSQGSSVKDAIAQLEGCGAAACPFGLRRRPGT
jgi:hypothetical protein